MSLSVERRKVVHAAVQKALYDGALTRPEGCENCGGTSPNRALDGHHHNGYDDEHILDVVWLCSACHHTVHPAPRQDTTQSPETKQRISESLKKAYAENRRARPQWHGTDNPFFGKTHSPETRRKMSEARRRRTS